MERRSSRRDQSRGLREVGRDGDCRRPPRRAGRRQPGQARRRDAGKALRRLGGGSPKSCRHDAGGGAPPRRSGCRHHAHARRSRRLAGHWTGRSEPRVGRRHRHGLAERATDRALPGVHVRGRGDRRLRRDRRQLDPDRRCDGCQSRPASDHRDRRRHRRAEAWTRRPRPPDALGGPRSRSPRGRRGRVRPGSARPAPVGLQHRSHRGAGRPDDRQQRDDRSCLGRRDRGHAGTRDSSQLRGGRGDLGDDDPRGRLPRCRGGPGRDSTRRSAHLACSGRTS